MKHLHGRMVLAVGLLAAGACARAEIVSVSFEPVESMNLTKVGTLDWAVFGRGEGSTKADQPFLPQASDFKKGGAGIVKELKVAGLTKAHGGAGARDYRFTGGGWSWTDGTRRPAVMHWTGFLSGVGMILEMGEGGQVAFQFDAPGAGKTRRAYVLVRRDHPIDLVAVQGAAEKVIDVGKGKSVGIAVVTFDGDQPLSVEMRTSEAKATARGFAAALGTPGDFRGGIPPARTPREDLLERTAGKGEPDYLRIVRAYADNMIEFGRDRYGDEKSPLFASTLTRDDPPTLLPYPEFKPGKNHGKDTGNVEDMVESGSWYQFNRFVNLPTLYDLGSEDAHKETVVGEDVLEDEGIYRTLWKLTELTGEARYKQEADKALDWWYTRTQSPTTGLYPWGEHLGWDFRYEAPSYSKGPVLWLYSCIYHEPRCMDFRDFLDALARAPRQPPFDRTPLERFALGLRDWHIWDLDRGYFTRHGDYFGKVKPKGHSEFPRIAGWFFDVWSKAYVASQDAKVREELASATDRLIAALDKRVKEVGYFPFTARHESEGGKPESFSDRQVLNAAAKIHFSGQRLRRARPDLAEKLLRFADGQIQYCIAHTDDKTLGSGAFADTVLASYRMTGRDDLKAMLRKAADGLIQEDLTVSSSARGPMPWARNIHVLVAAREVFGDAKYLDAAKGSARLAVELFFDDRSPLPTVSSVPIYLPDGREFPVYYHAALGDDDLMYALACLAAADPRASGESRPSAGR